MGSGGNLVGSRLKAGTAVHQTRHGHDLVTLLDRDLRLVIFVSAHMSSTVEFLVTVAEPTRLRILNCLAAAPLVVSDLQELLDLPQPTVSRHLTILRQAEVVHDTPVAPYVLYRLRRDAGPHDRLLDAVLGGLDADPDLRRERSRALGRSRGRARVVVPDRSGPT